MAMVAAGQRPVEPTDVKLKIRSRQKVNHHRADSDAELHGKWMCVPMKNNILWLSVKNSVNMKSNRSRQLRNVRKISAKID